jgi:hypothetical protein
MPPAGMIDEVATRARLSVDDSGWYIAVTLLAAVIALLASSFIDSNKGGAALAVYCLPAGNKKIERIGQFEFEFQGGKDTSYVLPAYFFRRPWLLYKWGVYLWINWS